MISRVVHYTWRSIKQKLSRIRYDIMTRMTLPVLRSAADQLVQQKAWPLRYCSFIIGSILHHSHRLLSHERVSCPHRSHCSSHEWTGKMRMPERRLQLSRHRFSGNRSVYPALRLSKHSSKRLPRAIGLAYFDSNPNGGATSSTVLSPVSHSLFTSTEPNYCF